MSNCEPNILDISTPKYWKYIFNQTIQVVILT